MKCKHCGAEIVDGHVYCDHCGREVQFVPDFNLFEEEVLPSMVGEDAYRAASKDTYSSHGKQVFAWLKKRKFGILFVLILLMCGYLFVHSYDFAYKAGIYANNHQDYEKAVTCFEKAVERRSTVEANLNLGKSYFYLGEYEKAEECYQLALDYAQQTNQDITAIYESLLTLYTELDNVTAIEQLYQSVKDEKVMKKLLMRFVQPPVFSKEEGDYSETVKLILSSPEEDCSIYYTLDDSEPEINNGHKFTKKIKLKEGETTVKAICIDSDGNRSPVVTKSYAIRYDIPEMPIATPSSGTFHAPVQVTLTSEGEGSIYYLWNGAIPSRRSHKYTGPIPIPEGNNVLSAVVITKHDKISEVLRCNYVYLP